MATGLKYRPLDVLEEEFRLLVLDNDTIQQDVPLRFTIEYASMKQVCLFDYQAVSYTWGSSTERRTIIVDGEAASVPTNAEIALRHFVNHSKSDRDGRSKSSDRKLTFWIDAICLNHSDLLEKSQQLLLMNQIYSEARRVLVWLGEDDPITPAAVDSIKLIVHQCRDETNDLADLLRMLWTSKRPKLQSCLPEELLPSRWNLEALRTFYSAPWFTRLWVVQEAAAAREALCFQGTRTISLSDVTLAARWMWYLCKGRLFPTDTNTTQSVIGIRNATEIWDCLPTPYSTSKLLRTFLAMGMEFDTSNPLDKVYGMLGLLEPRLSRIADTSRPPRYDASLVEVYTWITKAAIIDAWDLGLLPIACRAVNPGREEKEGAVEVPSWVPRYDYVLDFSKGTTYPLRPLGKGAANGVPMRLRRVEGLPGVLTVEGLIVDEIMHDASLEVESAGGLSDGTNRQISTAWSLTTTHARKDHYGSLEAAFAMALCTGQDSQLQHVSTNPTYLTNAATFFNKVDDPALQQLGEGLTSPEGKNGFHESGDREEYHTATSHSCHSRKFFITANGRLGMGPAASRRDDNICILPGSSVPVVLRKEGAFWRFLGDAYVFDLMDGNYFSQFEASGCLESAMQWFHIH